jgi:hypothetical protein
MATQAPGTQTCPTDVGQVGKTYRRPLAQFKKIDMNQIIRNICELPNVFNRGDKSAYQLAIESGFLISNKKDSLNLIREYIKDSPLLIEKWSIWSDDKRTNKGFFLQVEDKFLVGYVDYTKSGLIKSIEYETALDACSEFILLEICSILKIKETDKFTGLKWKK